MEINISDKYKCIFIHIPRSAGSSIKEALSLPGRGHPTYQYYMKNFPSKWAFYTKFTVVRNPWDRIVSAYTYAKMWKSYWHNTRMGPHPDYQLIHNKCFEKCCEILLNQRHLLRHEAWAPQYFWIMTKKNNDDLLVIDHILRYENLEDDFLKLCSAIGIKNLSLPIVNESIREKYTQYHTEKTKKIVETLFFKDIQMFNYTYDEE